MSQDALKRRVAEAALDFVEAGTVIGVGTGTTANFFIEILGERSIPLKGAVASSRASEERLRAIGVDVLDLNDVGRLSIYIDGADEADSERRLIKGGGGALTREKICAAAAERFVCIIDESKLVARLGSFPLPVEVIPMACTLVSRELAALGGNPLLRKGTVTDNGNVILDVRGLDISDPEVLEQRINNVAGVVCNGLFAMRRADVLLVATPRGIATL